MRMLALRSSGLDSEVLDYQKTLKVLFCPHGDNQNKVYYEDGKHFALKGKI